MTSASSVLPVDALSDELAAAITAAVDRWEVTAFQAGAGDRGRAEAGVGRAYLAAGLPEPERIVWVGSPLQGAVAAALATHPERARRALAPVAGTDLDALAGLVAGGGAAVREAVRTLPWERARTGLHLRLGTGGWTRAWGLSAERLWSPTTMLVTTIRRAVGEVVEVAEGDEIDNGAAEGNLLRECTLDAVLGQHDAPWLALFEAAGESSLTGLAEVAREAGWWWPFERVAIVCERPAELHRDESGRLHRAEGPALLFPDGFALRAWHGMPVPADFAEKLADLTAERIGEERNAELRRAMLEHFGYDRYLAESGAKPVHQDETGVLWRIDLVDDESVTMVEVVNSTAEPDGTFRRYWLRVPPSTRTARQGVAWTFGLTEEQYRPQKET